LKRVEKVEGVERVEEETGYRAGKMQKLK